MLKIVRRIPLSSGKTPFVHGLLCALVAVATYFVAADAIAAGSTTDTVHHDINVVLEPVASRLTVTDKITLPVPLPAKGAGIRAISFLLHDNLKIDSPQKDIERINVVSDRFKETVKQAGIPLAQYRVHLQDGETKFEIKYHGKIHHPLDEQANGTPGLISEQGIFLAHSSGWYPLFQDTELLTFTMKIQLPEGWGAVSQGKLKSDTGSKQRVITWSESHPQDDMYLVASRYHEYRDASGPVDAMVFLRSEDAGLAKTYLQATSRYIDMYNQLIGPYPYSKFALVENFWDTGYGMPSFTLLGPRVIRLPFIIYTSYPHEILHNYWGNGVFVDYAKGNWSEGLTAYLADHLLKEQRGQGAEYRRSVLHKYTDFVNKNRDFPLTEFRSRHSPATEAVGYGKTLMLFHMLRMRMGDEAFVNTIRSFYRQYRFRFASFANVQQIFNASTDNGLSSFFKQWIERAGALELDISDIQQETRQETANGSRIKFTLRQKQSGSAYEVQVPVLIYLAERQPPYELKVSMVGKQQTYAVTVPGKPLALDIDPRFDLFRRLDSREIPAALSQGFGDERPLLVLPANENPQLLQEFQKLAKQWRERQVPTLEIVDDDALDRLPGDRSVWILGWNNRFRDKVLASLKQHKVHVTDMSFSIGDKVYDKEQNAALLTTRHPANSNKTMLWLAADNLNAIPGLARKLPHYRKYSYLVFDGDEPTNVLKGQWAVNDSPMRYVFDKTLFDSSVPVTPHTPLTNIMH